MAILPKHTSHIALVGRGASDSGQRFVKLRINGDSGSETIILRESEIEKSKPQLEAVGAGLVSSAAVSELVNRIQENALKPTTFEVATRVGLRGESMALPGGPFPETDAFEVVLTDVPPEIQKKYCKAGTLEGWQELAALGKKNTRMILAFAFAFVGPISHVASIEHVGIQLLGEGGSGASSVAIAAACAWGSDPGPVQADRYGFGVSWNSTVNNLERTAAGFNQSLMFLNETGVTSGNKKKIAETVLECLMKFEGSSGRGRLTESSIRTFFAPLLSTSNVSVQELVQLAGIENAAPYVDRLIDIPLPDGGAGMFENLHGFSSHAELAVEMKRLAAANHGVASRRFIRRMLKHRASKPKDLEQFIAKRRAFYIRKASKLISSSRRDLTRLHGKLATVYAAGALAIKYGVLPFRRKALLAAILTCEADHVAYVDAQVESPNLAPTGIATLRAFLLENRGAFGASTDTDADIASTPGFLCRHDGRQEILVRNTVFEKLLGGKLRADRLKVTLADQGLLGTGVGNNSRRRFVVRRNIGGERSWVVALDARILDALT